MKEKKIYTSIWQDEIFATLSRAAKVLTLYCLTNRNLEQIRVYKISDREIMFDTGLNSSELEQAKEEVKNVSIYFLQGCCIIESPYVCLNYTGSKNEEAQNKQISVLPDTLQKYFELNIPYLKFLDTLSIPYSELSETSDTPSISISNSLSTSNSGKGVQGETKKPEHLPVSDEARIVLQKYNAVFGTKLSSTAGFSKNLSFWLTQYPLEEICGGIEEMPDDDWGKKITLDTLFRRKNTIGENVDYLSKFISKFQQKQNKSSPSNSPPLPPRGKDADLLI